MADDIIARIAEIIKTHYYRWPVALSADYDAARWIDVTKPDVGAYTYGTPEYKAWEFGFKEATVAFKEITDDAMWNLRAALTAFAIDCVENGDMTPGAKRMLSAILDHHLGEEEK